MQFPAEVIRLVEEQPYPLLFVSISGAHLFGFPSPDSDFDVRGVHILPITDVVGLNTPRESIDSGGVRGGLEMDLLTYDVRKYFALILKRDGNVLEQLHSPLVIRTSPEHDEPRHIARGCVTRHHVRHYAGFANTQWRLFEKASPRRVKPLLYVYRVLLTGIHLMQTGDVDANLVSLNDRYPLPFVPDLIARKLSGPEKSTLDDADFEFHRGEFDRLLTRLNVASDRSHLPENPTTEPDLNDLLLRVRGVA